MKKFIIIFILTGIIFLSVLSVHGDLQIDRTKIRILRIARINSIEITYNDCRMDFKLKGLGFSTTQRDRIIRFRSSTSHYDAHVSSWSNTQIHCYLQGNVKLGQLYKVFILNAEANRTVSNTKNLLLKTRLTQPPLPCKAGQKVVISGCLLGDAPSGRQLMISGVSAGIISWNCEEIEFFVPQLSAGVHDTVLKEGSTELSNTIQIAIH